RGKMGRGDLPVFVLNQMEVLDQKIAAPRPVAQQEFDFMPGDRIDLPALRGRLGPLASLTGVVERANLLHIISHEPVSFPLFHHNSSSWHARCQARNSWRRHKEGGRQGPPPSRYFDLAPPNACG